MAKLLKQRARSPIMETAGVVGSLGNGGYRLELYPMSRDDHSYDVVLSRAEMLGVVSSWLGAEARAAADDAKRAANADSSSSTPGKSKP